MRRLFVSALFCLAISAPASAGFKYPVQIRFLQPNQLAKLAEYPEYAPTMYQSGWPIVIQLTMRDEIGIATQTGPFFFPQKNRTGYVIFEDPDGCLAMDSFAWGGAIRPAGCGGETDPRPPSDETYIEFTPDVDEVGILDFDGNPDILANSDEAGSGGQSFFNPETTANVTIGAPTTGFRVAVDPADETIIQPENILDGYGNGADDDLPGLVLVAQHGQGILYDSDGVAASPLTLVNLAGFTNSVAYQLNNVRNRTMITATMVVPRSLFAPFVVADDCVGPSIDDCSPFFRIDGSTAERAADDILGDPPGTNVAAFSSYQAIYNQTDFKVSAFVVSGIGPDQVVDMDGNGSIETRDLEMMGYRVLGRQKNMYFKQLSNGVCQGGVFDVIYRDFDGNGISQFAGVCPAGPGGLSSFPR